MILVQFVMYFRSKFLEIWKLYIFWKLWDLLNLKNNVYVFSKCLV